MKILVTVGTTQFDALVDKCISCLDGHDLILQVGHYKGILPPNAFRFSQDMAYYYDNVDYIISHGGSGTILNALDRHKPILVVCNPNLVDDHQMELATKLEQLHLIHYTTLSDFELPIAPLEVRPPKNTAFLHWLQSL